MATLEEQVIVVMENERAWIDEIVLGYVRVVMIPVGI